MGGDGNVVSARSVAPSSNDLQGAMVIAVIAMWMMQVVVHQVVDMIAMRHGLMPAVRAMNVFGPVARTVMAVCAVLWIDGGHLQDMFVYLIRISFTGVMQVTIVEVAHVAIVTDRGMAAATSVVVIMTGVVLMRLLRNHRDLLAVVHAWLAWIGMPDSLRRSAKQPTRMRIAYVDRLSAQFSVTCVGYL